MRAHSQKQSQVHTESSDVGASFTAHPKDAEMTIVVKFVQLAFVDGSDTELSLDGGDQWRSLEQSTSQCLESPGELSLASGQLVVQSNNTHVFFSSALLRFDQPSRAIDADNKTSRNFGIEGATVTSLLDSEYPLDPRNNFVTGWIRGLVEIDDTGGDIGFEIAF